MKVKELIELLKNEDQDKEIYIPDWTQPGMYSTDLHTNTIKSRQHKDFPETIIDIAYLSHKSESAYREDENDVLVLKYL